MRTQLFGTTGPIWYVILGRTSSERGSQNHVFGHHAGEMMKKSVQRRHPKTHSFLYNFSYPDERILEDKTILRIISVAKQQVFGSDEIYKKSMPKGVQQIIKIGVN